MHRQGGIVVAISRELGLPIASWAPASSQRHDSLRRETLRQPLFRLNRGRTRHPLLQHARRWPARRQPRQPESHGGLRDRAPRPDRRRSFINTSGATRGNRRAKISRREGARRNALRHLESLQSHRRNGPCTEAINRGRHSTRRRGDGRSESCQFGRGFESCRQQASKFSLAFAKTRRAASTKPSRAGSNEKLFVTQNPR